MSRRTIIFDFDGTIADTHHFIVRISNRLAPIYGFRTISWDELEGLRDRTTKQIIDHLKIPVLKIPSILAHAKKEFHADIGEVGAIEGLMPVLHDLRAADICMGILSSNTSKNINAFLSAHDLHLFDFVHSTSKIWSKHHSLERLIRFNDFDKDSIYYVGDEVRDVVSAKKSGVKSIAVSWGYNSQKALREAGPDYLIDDPTELTQFVSPLQDEPTPEASIP